MSRSVHLLAMILFTGASAGLLGAEAQPGQPALRVDIHEFRSQGWKYFGRTVTLDAEVDEVYGPRLFTVDDPAWGDLGGEVLVFARGLGTVAVKDEDRVTVTGTVRTVADSGLDGEWGWRKVAPDAAPDALKKPLIVATRIVATGSGLELYDATRADRPASVPPAPAIIDVSLVATATADLVGRAVELRNVRVLRLAHPHGFFIAAPAGVVFVLPDHLRPLTVADGELVTIHGILAAMPRWMPDEFEPPVGWNNRVYIVATVTEK
jgi:hypothetical protein